MHCSGSPPHMLRMMGGFSGKVIPCFLANKLSGKHRVASHKLIVKKYSQTSNPEAFCKIRPTSELRSQVRQSSLFTLCHHHHHVSLCSNGSLHHSITRSYSNGTDDANTTLQTTNDSDAAVGEFQDELKNLMDNHAESKKQAKLDIPKATDFAIIGGGSFGLSTAYWLKKRNPEGFSLTVIERDPTYSRSWSTLGLASISQQFSLPENVKMSLFSAQFYREMCDSLRVLDLDPPDIQFNPQGYLMLSQNAEGKQILEENYVIQREQGAQTELMNPGELKAKFPWLNTTDLELGSYGLSNEGWFDPWLYLTALKIKCMSLGVKFVKGEVNGFTTEDQTATVIDDGEIRREKKLDKVQIKAEDGKTYSMKFAACVNCAGPWSGQVAAMAGIGTAETGSLAVPLPVEPRKRYVYVFHCPDGPGLNMPMLIDPLGVYVRREGLGGCYICGASPKSGEEPPITDLEVDYKFFEENIWPVLAHRIPAFAKLKLKSAWAGFYDYNTFDQNLIIGNHPVHRNFMMATGCSGHGVQQSPAIGRAMAEYMLDDEYTTIDLSRFSFDRILEQTPIFEQSPYVI